MGLLARLSQALVEGGEGMVVGHASLPLSPYTTTGLGQFSHSRQPALQPFTLGLLRNGQLIGSITGSAGIVRHSPKTFDLVLQDVWLVCLERWCDGCACGPGGRGDAELTQELPVT